MAVPLNVQQNAKTSLSMLVTHKTVPAFGWIKTCLIQGIEKTLLRDPKLERLYAAYLSKCSARKQLRLF